MARIGEDVEIGTALEPVSRTFSVDMFAGATKTIHNDREAAEREGLSAPVAVGPQVAALIFRMLRAAFGAGWIQGGRVSLTFRRPTFCGAAATAHGVVTGKQREGGGTRLTCDVWVETADGEKTIVGTASGLAGGAAVPGVD